MFSISDTTIQPTTLRQQFSHDQSGALVTFEGLVRNHNDGRAVDSLEYEAHRALAEKEGHAILQEAIERFDLHQACCAHRVGHLQIGDLAVWVGVSSAHRDDAFTACRYIVDEVKRRVPIWKREHYSDGDPKWLEGTPGA